MVRIILTIYLSDLIFKCIYCINKDNCVAVHVQKPISLTHVQQVTMCGFNDKGLYLNDLWHMVQMRPELKFAG